MIHKVSTSAASHTHRIPKFESSSHPSTAKLNEVKAPVTRHNASTTVANELKAATTDNWVLYGSTFKVDKKELAGILADPKRLNAFGYSLIFRAGDGTTKNLGWGGSGPSGPDMKVTPVAKGSELFKNVLATVDEQFEPSGPAPSQQKGLPPSPKTQPPQMDPATKAQKQKVDQNARAALESMLHEPHTKLYWAAWDNADDTTVKGAIAVNEKTGDVRVLGLWSPA